MNLSTKKGGGDINIFFFHFPNYLHYWKPLITKQRETDILYFQSFQGYKNQGMADI